ncbi:branched chain amino acid ABC transporter substrate-binding protein [Deinococcus daejeonensis]|uniref:Branched chain amino acid ABC transporter substrate-binding protein n=2 Tax=Deinococcus daejeonensis TaxID=1007098 RepID=A0ABQ2JH84_9DEIO|nr:branched chain amino acid ABC transporter substrate-binding protein [Deinococcus daejeonensis]
MASRPALRGVSTAALAGKPPTRARHWGMTNILRNGSRLLRHTLLVSLTLGAAAHAETIKVVSISPLTGPKAGLGIELRRGAEMALRMYTPLFNKFGHSLKLLPLDDQANPTRAGLLSRVLQGDQRILGIMGPQNSGVTNALATALKASPIAMVSPTSTNDALTGQGWTYFGRVVAPDRAQAVAAAQYIAQTLKPQSVYVISDNTTYGNGLTTVMQDNLGRLNVTVAGYVGASTPEQVEDAVRRVKGTDPDVVYYAGTDVAGVPLIKALRAAGVKAPFVGGDGLYSATFTDGAGPAAQGVVFSSTFAVPDKLPLAQRFVAEYRARYKAEPNPRALYAFDAMSVMLRGILNEVERTKGGVPTREQVIASVRKVNLPACAQSAMLTCPNLTGALSFDPSGERRSSFVYMLEYGKSGGVNLISSEAVDAAQLK